MLIVKNVENELQSSASPTNAEFLQKFFKTGPGQYGEKDKFLGVRNPQTRLVAKKYYKLISNDEIKELLQSQWHEVRLCALIIASLVFSKASDVQKKELFEMYLRSITNYINNWDLVDLSAPNIVGNYLLNKDRGVLFKLAQGNLWQKRVAILATFTFIRQDDLVDSLRLAKILLFEKHDLLHKAVGWMLREIGKKDATALNSFLDQYAATMPRTTLRYAIERLSKNQKLHYMSLKKYQINFTG